MRLDGVLLGFCEALHRCAGKDFDGRGEWCLALRGGLADFCLHGGKVFGPDLGRGSASGSLLRSSSHRLVHGAFTENFGNHREAARLNLSQFAGYIVAGYLVVWIYAIKPHKQPLAGLSESVVFLSVKRRLGLLRKCQNIFQAEGIGDAIVSARHLFGVLPALDARARGSFERLDASAAY